jgi:multidrug efflux pump subunit AcrA (membrane-fusion protein)
MSAGYPSEVDDRQAWHDIEQAMAEIAALSLSEVPFPQLASELLTRTVHLLAARGGAVWVVEPDAGLRLRAHLNIEALTSSLDARFGEFRQQLFEDVRCHKQPRLVPPGSATRPNSSLTNPTDYLWIVHPLVIDTEVVGLIEVFQRPTTDAAALQGNRRLLALVGEAALNHLKRGRIRHLQASQARSARLEDFVKRIHRSLDLEITSYALANEGRVLIDCGRLSIAVRAGRKYRLAAMSGVDTLNRRGNVIRRLESLASTIGQTGDSLWYDGDTQDLSPQVAEQLEAYVDLAHARMITVVPMTVPPAGEGSTDSTVGVLIAEDFDRITDSSRRENVELVARQGALALRNALDYRSLPTLPFARARGGGARYSLRTRLLAWMLGLGAMTFIVVMLLCVPTEFVVGARGELQPKERHDVYAPCDGKIVEMRVVHDTLVSAGDVLLVLSSAEIDLELEKTRGEFETTKKRLASVESALMQGDPRGEVPQYDSERMAAEHEELKLLLASQQRQIVLLSDERQELTVCSPIDGRVLTWNVERLLEDRPVQRGQILLTIANPHDDWMAELRVPDDRIGYILAASREQRTPLTASFELATEPGIVHTGVLTGIANRAELTGGDRSTVQVKLDVPANESIQMRPGATILARINCGQKPLGYVWFHDLFTAVRQWMWL